MGSGPGVQELVMYFNGAPWFFTRRDSWKWFVRRLNEGA